MRFDLWGLGQKRAITFCDIFARFGDEISKNPYDQGFYTSKGRFVSREEGMKIAYEAGQVNYYQAFKKNGKFNILYSEDLY